MGKKSPLAWFVESAHKFRAKMVEAYLESYLRYSRTDSVIIMRTPDDNIQLNVSVMEVRPDGVFLKFTEREWGSVATSMEFLPPAVGSIEKIDSPVAVKRNCVVRFQDECSSDNVDGQIVLEESRIHESLENIEIDLTVHSAMIHAESDYEVPLDCIPEEIESGSVEYLI